MKFLVTILLFFSIAFSTAQKNSISEDNIDYDGTFKDGKLWNGRHYIYDEYGLLERIEVFKNGKFIGNGVLGGKEELLTDTINQLDKDGKKTGYWIITGSLSKEKGYADTAVVQEGYYKRSRKIGIWIKYWPDGNLKSEIEFLNGRSSGIFTTYYQSGCIEELSIERSWGNSQKYFDDCLPSSDRGTIDTNYTQITHQRIPVGTWEDANPSHIYCDTCTSLIVGDEDTKYIFTSPPKQDSLNGYKKIYDSDGNILLDGEFKDGDIYNGKYYVYDEFGLLDHIEIYKGGKYAGHGVLVAKDKY